MLEKDKVFPCLEKDSILFADKLVSPVLQPDCGGQLLPPIIRLINHVGSTDKPMIYRLIDKAMVLDRPALSYIVLDFDRAITIESCVAQFLERQSRRLVSQSPKVHLVITGTRLGSDIQARLSQAGLHCTQPLGDSLPSGKSAYGDNLAFDSVDDFLRICRLSSPKPALPPCAALRSEEASSRGAWRHGQERTHISSIMRDLEPHLPMIHLQNEDSMVRGFAIRKIAQGQAIACGRYAFKPTFLVLCGKVLIQKPHGAPFHALPQQVVRDSCRKMLTYIRNWPRSPIRECENVQGTVNTEPQYLAKHEMYDGSSGNFTCAHGATDSCWILEIDPQNKAVVAAVQRVASL
jgi:hypothetical protein